MDRISLLHFIEASQLADLDLTSGEFAEVCWLAEARARRVELPGDERHEQLLAGTDTQAASELPSPDWTGTPGAPSPEGGAEIEGTAEMRAAQLRATPYEPPGLTLRSPAAPALPRRLAFARALRPLKRKIPSRTAEYLDEAATAERAADTDLWLPVLRPAPDRWLDLAVVIDDTPSMTIWRRTVTELLQVLKESGTFRSVRIWRCNSDDAAELPLTVRGETTTAIPGRDPRELIDAAGQRMILVVSDRMGAGWRDRRMAQVLGVWGAAGLVAVIDLLPQRMWEQGGQRIFPVQLRSIEPATCNAQLQCRSREPTLEVSRLRIPVPVLELNDHWLAGWAAMLAGVATGWTNSMVIFPDAPASEDGDSAGPDEDVDPDVRVKRFRAQASPQAFRLATLLAAAAPLRLPVVSRRRESHPPPLVEPCVTVSRYTAPVVEPLGSAPWRQWMKMPG